ncbi:MAG: phosphate acyltransferase PlsX [Desulfovibrionales bacterium]
MNKSGRICIAVDAMGGDHGQQVVVPGALAAARKSDLKIILVGQEAILREELARHKTAGLDIEIHHAPEVAGMGDKPSEVLRKKKYTSVQEAFRLVKGGTAQGVVSAGNSGVTLASGVFTLGRIKGIERPALASILPTEKDPLVLIDVGANVDCKPHHLVQFGLMAEVLSRAVLGRQTPRVGILSIGEEEGKGNTQVKEAFTLLRSSSLNFIGNIEGRDLFSGDVDVVVCDGFVGNVALKVIEGLASSLAHVLKKELKSSLLSKLGTVLTLGSLKRFSRHVDYAEYGGAPLLGLKGFAVVCHGASNEKAIRTSVQMAAQFIASRANDHLTEGLSANKDLSFFGRKLKSSLNRSSEANI